MSLRCLIFSLCLFLSPFWAMPVRAVERSSQQSAVETLALVIGYNGGGFGLPTLRYADDDALRFATILQDEPSSPQSAKIVVLTQLDDDTAARSASRVLPFAVAGPPTRARVLAAFDDLARTLSVAKQHQRVFVIYAGHGLTNRLLLAPEHNEAAALSGHELRAAIAKLSAANANAEIFLFVDACRSQSLFTTRGLDGPDMSQAIENLEGRSLGAHVGVITAATSGKPAGELARLESGYFSHVLLSGIVGGADADEDDRISFGELAAFVAFHTQAMMGQRPWFDPPAGDLSAVAFDHRARLRQMVLPREIEGRFEVRGPTGRPVFAELFKDGKQRIKLALPAGNYHVVQASPRVGLREVNVSLTSSSAVNLGTAAWQATVTDARGDLADDNDVHETALGFKSPFSSDVVSTLQAGFDSGRTPVFAGEGPVGRRWLRVMIGMNSSPLELSGASYSGGLGLRWLLGKAFVGAELASQIGRYASTTEDYTLLQSRLLLQGGLWTCLGNSLWTLAWLEGGAGNLFRFAARTSGDGFVPRLGVGVSFTWRISDAWLLGVSPRAFVQWIGVDAGHVTDTGAALEAELGYAF